MRKIRVTGYMYVEEDDMDESPENTSGIPLTEEAYDSYVADIPLDDLTFEVVE